MRTAQRRAEQRRSMLVKVGAVAVVLAVIAGVAVAVLSQRDGSSTVAGDGTPPGVTDQGAARLGAEGAPVTVPVVEDFQAAAADGVTGTPTTFVDGKQLDGFQLADVQAAVEQTQS
jgi:protein-disulfide isomerase